MADAILVAHFLIVAFIVGGLVLTWIGAAAGWRWVRSATPARSRCGKTCCAAA
jgi:hypothetical protein